MRTSSKIFSLFVTVAASALVLAGCTSDSTSSEPTTPEVFIVGSDGSAITPSGFVFKSDFAICNKAKCKKLPGQDKAQCECEKLTDEWTLSPVPAVTLKSLTTATSLMSTFTSFNTEGASSVPCEGGEFADCYGALCEVDPATGIVSCECPFVDKAAGSWVKYVDDCKDGSCSSDFVSAAPIYTEGSTGFSDFAAAVKQLGGPEASLPKPCAKASEDTTTSSVLGLASGDCE